MFIDEAKILVKAGDGGNGCLAFRREKYVPRGGPSGGDGGRGGDILVTASKDENTLLRYRFNPEHKAQRGRHGEGSNCRGQEGHTIELKVPIGTVIYDEATQEKLFDFTEAGQTFTAARGGRGGRGNARFVTSTHQAPTEHEEGRPGEEKHLRLELKLLADAGLVGFPNAGKSTLISRISAARPKIADYPFTTLEPNLGVVQLPEYRTFVVADIPGIIEGAHRGHGLGLQFLRHIERTSLLVHLVDMSETGRDPLDDFTTLLTELESFSEDLARKPMFVVASKIDSSQDPTALAALSAAAQERNLPFFEISSVTGEGLDRLRFAMAEAVLPASTVTIRYPKSVPMHIRKQRLLTPGPTPLYPPALHAMMASDMHHRTQEFRNVYQSALAGLKEVFATSSDVLCFAASGTGAMDAAVSNLFSQGDKVIICSAGKFGERWVEIAKAYGLDALVLQEEYGQVVSPTRVRQAFAQRPDTRAVFVTASETSTGAQHDVRAMGEFVRSTPALLIVDAITAVGTMPLDIDAWGLDIVVGGSQKAFMIPPGLAFLAVSAKAWKFADTATLPHFYFNLKKEKKSGDAGESSWTPATSLILALDEALKYIRGIGMPKLVENAQLLAQATRQAAHALGLEVFAAQPGSSVTALRAPAGLDSGIIVKEFKSRFGAIIANGQGSMKGQIFRIAHLGYFDFADLFAVIGALEIILHANGYPLKFGTGVAAVQEVYARAALPHMTAAPMERDIDLAVASR